MSTIIEKLLEIAPIYPTTQPFSHQEHLRHLIIIELHLRNGLFGDKTLKCDLSTLRDDRSRA